MTDKQWRTKKKVVKKILDKWVETLGLRWWRLRYLWKAGDPPDVDEGSYVAAQVNAQWMYRVADITIWLEAIPDKEEDIERLVVHELCHILVSPIRPIPAERHEHNLEEYVVEGLAQAFIWTKQGK